MRINNRLLQSAIKASLIGGALLPLPVLAQTAPNEKAADIGDVVVTGSRIAVPNEVSISPVIGVTADDVSRSGATRVEDLLNTLPQVFASQGSNISNGSDGTATINLRNLGSNRNLVLVNGRRLGPGDASGGNAADVNQVPIELIDRVDVLTGGASSVYGADAVAGVVNFQLNNHYEGIKIVSNYSFNQHANHDETGAAQAVAAAGDTPAPSHVVTGDTKSLALIFGFNTQDGKGNSTSYATYRDVAAVLQSSYDYSACTLNSGYVTQTGKFSCGGSSTSFPGRFRLQSTTGKAIGPSVTIGPNGALTPWSGSYLYNYGPLNYYQRPDERWTFGNFTHYEFNEHADVYTETMWMRDASTAQIAPSGAFAYGNYTLSCSDPQLSAAMITAWCNGATTGNFNLGIGRRNVEGGGRQYTYDHESLRQVIGVKGKINDTWTYDVSGQFNTVDQSSYEGNDLSSARIANALDVIPGSNGTAVCASALAVSQGCVPWNIFQSKGVTPAALSYLSVPAIETGELRQYIFDANTTGDLGKYGVKVPTAASGVKVNVGYEWREIKSQTDPDLELTSGDISGSGSPTTPVGGSIISSEGFVEANVPLVDDMRYAKSVLLNTGYRYSNYSTGFNTNTYKYGVEWTPVNDIRARASWARAVRAPDIGELYSAQVVGLDGSSDPCAGAKPSLTQAQCALTGVSASQYGKIDANSAAQYNGLTGGNPKLLPETAVTKSFGVGWTPSQLPNYRLQLDWSEIKISKIIESIGETNVIETCATQDQGCNLIHRDVNGSLWESTSGYVVDQLVNSPKAAGVKTIDVDSSYSLRLDSWGKVDFSILGTYFLTELGVNGSGCVGLYGSNCGTPEPRWRHTFSTTWQTPWNGADISLRWRFIGKVRSDLLSSDPSSRVAPGSDAELIANGDVPNTDAYVASRSYLDLTGSFKIIDSVTAQVGINNLLDKDPPIFGNVSCAPTICNGNTFPQVYDALGRYVFVKLVAQF